MASLIAVLGVAAMVSPANPYGLTWESTPEEIANLPGYDLYWHGDEVYDLIPKSCVDAICGERVRLEFTVSGSLHTYSIVHRCDTIDMCAERYAELDAWARETFGPPLHEAGVSLAVQAAVRWGGGKVFAPREMPPLIWHRHSTEVSLASMEFDAQKMIIAVVEKSTPSMADMLYAADAWLKDARIDAPPTGDGNERDNVRND